MSHYESPEYQIKFKEDAFELREYYDFYIVEYENPSDPDLDRGFGTLTYSGNSSPRKEEAQMSILEKWVHQKNYTITSNFMVAIYNGPYVPPFFRHNEVMVRVAVSE